MLGLSTKQWEALRDAVPKAPERVIKVNPYSARVLELNKREEETQAPQSMVKIRSNSRGLVSGFYWQVSGGEK